MAATGRRVTSRRAEVLPLAAAQYVQRSSSTALAARIPRSSRVPVAGCLEGSSCRATRTSPELLQQGDILRVEFPCREGGMLKLSVSSCRRI
jgi:hypothetical protein